MRDQPNKEAEVGQTECETMQGREREREKEKRCEGSSIEKMSVMLCSNNNAGTSFCILLFRWNLNTEFYEDVVKHDEAASSIMPPSSLSTIFTHPLFAHVQVTENLLFRKGDVVIMILVEERAQKWDRGRTPHAYAPSPAAAKVIARHVRHYRLSHQLTNSMNGTASFSYGSTLHTVHTRET
eukprot:gene10643-7391_t